MDGPDSKQEFQKDLNNPHEATNFIKINVRFSYM